jgi:hypothetical protein
MSRDRAEQRSLEQTVELACVSNERVGRPRGCLGSGLDVIEVRVDACHPFSQVHLKIPYYTIRSLLVSLNVTKTEEHKARAEQLGSSLGRMATGLRGDR